MKFEKMMYATNTCNNYSVHKKYQELTEVKKDKYRSDGSYGNEVSYMLI